MFAVKNDDGPVLGHIIIFTLPGILIARDTLVKICTDLKMPVTVGGRYSKIDAFRSATSDINDKIIDIKDGMRRERKVYCQKNGKSENFVSCELICETLGQITNTYKKLANFYFIKTTNSFDYRIEDSDSSLNIAGYCEEVEKQYELYQKCVARNQFENLIDKFLEIIGALKIDVHGKVYFVPKKNMKMVALFEDFIESINANNIRSSEINFYSLFIADNTKQRGKIANEFYHNARHEIKNYMQRLETLIASNSSNPALLERWAKKVDLLQSKKAEYETLLQRELVDLDEEYQALDLLSGELKLRAKKIRQNS